MIYQTSFLVSGIMCHQGCGAKIQNTLAPLDELKKQRLIPNDARLIIDAEPEALGIHRLHVMIEGEASRVPSDAMLSKHFKTKLKAIGFEILDSHPPEQASTTTHWINFSVNLIAILAIILLSIAFPPSLPLTLGLTLLSYVTTAFTARHHLLAFYHQVRQKTFDPMATPITLGWLLSLAHTLYHAITMPSMHSTPTVFMNFIMPVVLIGITNVMDEIKRLIMSKSKSMHLTGIKALFPQMAEHYEGYVLSKETQDRLSTLLKKSASSETLSNSIQALLMDADTTSLPKKSLSEGMIILVKRGTCFPVDGLILQGQTLIDAKILTGEPEQPKRCLDKISGGSINLGQDVLLYVTQNAYNSTVNRLLFRSNRAQTKQKSSDTNTRFTYLYLGLILASIIASVVLPLALGIATIPLMLQNVFGILFAVCPCTIAIAHLWPKLLSVYRRHQHGVVLRSEQLTDTTEEPHTFVFDKTGTLTTGRGEVSYSEGISNALWQKIFLLERRHGEGHPVAEAITRFYQTTFKTISLIKDIEKVCIDKENRGLSATVQGTRIHLGNLHVLKSAGIVLPKNFSKAHDEKLALGMTPVYVAENGVYQGIIFIKHEVRTNVINALKRLKQEGKTLIMLTGDSLEAALGFNQQQGHLFELQHIQAAHTPHMKETFVASVMQQTKKSPNGVWFVGDGLNDAPCARIISDKGGISAAITHDDKASFFTDISLNGSLDYVFEHHRLNQFLKKNVTQNQGLLAYGSLVFLAFILCCSVVGIAVSPIIPMGVMVSTTLLTLFNAHRVSLFVNNTLSKNNNKLSKFMASNGSIGLLVGALTCFLGGLLVSSFASGGLTLPAILFTAGAATAISSVCMIAAGLLAGAFSVVGLSYLGMTSNAAESVIKDAPFISKKTEHGSTLNRVTYACTTPKPEVYESSPQYAHF